MSQLTQNPSLDHFVERWSSFDLAARGTNLKSHRELFCKMSQRTQNPSLDHFVERWSSSVFAARGTNLKSHWELSQCKMSQLTQNQVLSTLLRQCHGLPPSWQQGVRISSPTDNFFKERKNFEPTHNCLPIVYQFFVATMSRGREGINFWLPVPTLLVEGASLCAVHSVG